MENSFTQAFPSFAKNMQKQFIRYAVQKQMFCEATGKILDFRTCILFEATRQGQPHSTMVLSPDCVDKLTDVKTRVTGLYPDLEVKFTTLNKKLKHELLTLIK